MTTDDDHERSVGRVGYSIRPLNPERNMICCLSHLALNAESQELQVSAAVAWLDRVEGKPIAQAVQSPSSPV